MSDVYRVTGYYQGKIGANIEDVWALITDWGSLAWFDDGSNTEGMKMMESWLEGEPNAIPRTRVMSRGDGAVKNGAPLENREVLLLADPVAHRLYYDATDDFAAGIRNYIASWCLDETDDGGCLMTISSNFDCVPASVGEQQSAMLHGVYIAIVSSLDKHFAKIKQSKKTD
ncbi:MULTISPECIES: SRPBCC family protein [Sphingobium]|uniref:SRPBCC family protein n=1 Tax=Sphingobium TaxID=165695 RepID=UPI00159C4AD6